MHSIKLCTKIERWLIMDVWDSWDKVAQYFHRWKQRSSIIRMRKQENYHISVINVKHLCYESLDYLVGFKRKCRMYHSFTRSTYININIKWDSKIFTEYIYSKKHIVQVDRCTQMNIKTNSLITFTTLIVKIYTVTKKWIT